MLKDLEPHVRVKEDQFPDIRPLKDADIRYLEGFGTILDGLVIEQGMFSEKVLWIKDMENLFFSLTRKLIDFHLATIDDVEVIPRVARRKDGLPL